MIIQNKARRVKPSSFSLWYSCNEIMIYAIMGLVNNTYSGVENKMFNANCLRCKNKLKLLVTLTPIKINRFERNGVKQVVCKYNCSCGSKFDRIFFE